MKCSFVISDTLTPFQFYLSVLVLLVLSLLCVSYCLSQWSGVTQYVPTILARLGDFLDSCDECIKGAGEACIHPIPSYIKSTPIFYRSPILWNTWTLWGPPSHLTMIKARKKVHCIYEKHTDLFRVVDRLHSCGTRGYSEGLHHNQGKKKSNLRRWKAHRSFRRLPPSFLWNTWILWGPHHNRGKKKR